MRQIALSLVIAAAALAAASPASAEKIYKYVDADGVVVFTNVPPGAPRKAMRVEDRGETARISGPREWKPRKGTSEYDAHLEEACDLYKIPLPLARAVMAAESNYNPLAVSHAGAQGLMQLMPGTAAEMFVTDAFDPKQNIHGGVRYLRVLANMFDGDMVRMIAAYNAGPDAVKRAGGIPNIAETQEYVRRVLRLYFSFKDGA